MESSSEPINAQSQTLHRDTIIENLDLVINEKQKEIDQLTELSAQQTSRIDLLISIIEEEHHLVELYRSLVIDEMKQHAYDNSSARVKISGLEDQARHLVSSTHAAEKKNGELLDLLLERNITIGQLEDQLADLRRWGHDVSHDV